MEQKLSSIQNSLVEEISSSKNEPEWLKEYRKNSLNIYNELPAEVSPLYNKYTDAKRMNPDMVSLSTNSDSKLPDFLSKRFEEVKKENGLIQVGTNIISTNLSDELKSKGVVISSIDDALIQHQELTLIKFYADLLIIILCTQHNVTVHNANMTTLYV